MSRIDEALRRAAENAGGTKPSSNVPHAVGMDVADLEREAYPVEIANRRTMPRQTMPRQTMPSQTVPAQTVPAQTVPPQSVPSVAAPRRLKEATPVAEAPSSPTAHREHSVADRLLEFPRRNLAEKLVVDTQISPRSLEQYRRLAATLHHAQTADGLKVVMIASALQGEGKTLTAANLALTFSESYRRRVLLIDADLRHPSQHAIFGVDNSAGLSDLTAKPGGQLKVRELSSRLALLPAGPPSADPMAGLTSDRMQRVIDEARDAFEWVIVDTPPLVLLTDANLLSAMVDAAVLVIRAGQTPFDMVNRAVAVLGRERILGVVLNGEESVAHTSRDAYDYYGQSAPASAREAT